MAGEFLARNGIQTPQKANPISAAPVDEVSILPSS
jgi:hypothetical protein